MADNIRSIPSIADGLNSGQRKVIWTCFKRKIKKEIKAAELARYVSKHAAYHHGEVDLGKTITNLAQDFMGSNNLSLLRPVGQFGTREHGGKDRASLEYIFTYLAPISRVIFNPTDDALLTPQKEDDQVIEPEWYLPILPMLLVNGAKCIGKGPSISIPCYNPVDIVANLRRLMNDEEMFPMVPWWHDFKGEIKLSAKHKYAVTGVVRTINKTTVEITELPIHVWTYEYKVHLESRLGNDIKAYKEHSVDSTNVHLIITMGAKELEKAKEQGLIKFFNLTSKIITSNMTCLDFEGKIRKYDSPEEILEAFYPVRLAYYEKRKDYLENELQTALEKLTSQVRFIQMIVDKQLVVSNRKKADIVMNLREHGFQPFPKVTAAAAKGGNDENEMNVESGKGKGGGKARTGDYDYLLGKSPSLTEETIEKLKGMADDKEKELLKLLDKTPKSMWAADLDEFMKAWKVGYCRTAPSKRKAAVVVESDSEEDIAVDDGTDEDELSSRPSLKGKRKAPEKLKSTTMDDEESDGATSTNKPVAKKTKVTDPLDKVGPRKISKSMKSTSQPKTKAKPKRSRQ